MYTKSTSTAADHFLNGKTALHREIKDELKEEPKPGWVHWFFSFDDNAGLPEEKKQRIIQNTPKGTKIWKNKIEGLRGKATGLVFPNFSRKKHVVSEKWLRSQMAAGKIKFKKFTCGLDTSYSSKSPDTIAMMFQGITEDRKLITLAEKVYSNKELDQPLAPSDTAVKFVEFLERCRKDWGFAKDTFVDCADAATITELRKYKRLRGCLYNFVESYKKVEILDRIKLQLRLDPAGMLFGIGRMYQSYFGNGKVFMERRQRYSGR